ncbi:MAG: shikimate kinase [Limnobacter sp.]|nr:shikimate kinase [Limnobacter sp.]
MGAGKSTVGKALAKFLGWDFCDIDHMVEKSTGVSIPTIFEIEGEDGFRKRETTALENFEGATHCVLATGGGIVLAPKNRPLLKKTGKVVFLKASAHDVYQRTRLDRNRPLLQDPDPHKKIRELLAFRTPLYKGIADLTIETGRQPVHTIVQKICTALHLQPPTLHP